MSGQSCETSLAIPDICALATSQLSGDPVAHIQTRALQFFSHALSIPVCCTDSLAGKRPAGALKCSAYSTDSRQDSRFEWLLLALIE